MTRFEWNGLRRGDAVSVHLGPTGPTRPAAVLANTTRARADSAVSFRVGGGGGIVWPARATVHRAVTEPTCWRCADTTPVPA